MEAVNQNIDLLQIIEVEVAGNIYGVNILKVKEILEKQEYTNLPNSPKAMTGLFNHRGDVIPVINLYEALNIPKEQPEDHNILLLNFNDTMTAFEVDSVIGTSTHNWDNISSLDDILKLDDVKNNYTGIIKNDEKMIILLDFESIVAKVNGKAVMANLSTTTASVSAGNKTKLQEDNKEIRIVYAEDSGLMSELIKKELNNAGYTNLVPFKDGKTVTEYINTTDDDVNLFILDIEMPFVNGFTITKQVKEHKKHKDTPVILFSSLINDEIRTRGDAAGADCQISKPEIGELIDVVNKLLNN